MSNEISNERLEKLAAQVTMRELAKMAKELLALRNAREGWQLVPIEPTREMREAFHTAHDEAESGDFRVYSPDHQWQAMLAAAPEVGSLLRCAAARDGECNHAQCPQLRDGEPENSGRHCPIDNWDEED